MHILWNEDRLTLSRKLRLVPWGLVGLVVMLGLVGTLLLYSSGGGSWEPWARDHLLRFALGCAVMLLVALIDIRFWFRQAYLLYGAVLALLLLVELMGQIGMGAQRWINLGFIVLQPSELMKIALAIVLARYFHGLPEDQIVKPLALLPPLLMVGAPVGLVLLQPNLGTALLLALASAAMFFIAGVRWWKFLLVILAIAGAAPLAYEQLHDYQRQRLLTFLNPEADPLGAGYNIMQSKIALGAGGLTGRGFLQGSQGQLEFLPEKHTDFIFVLLGEEWGWLGTMGVLMLFFLLLASASIISLKSASQFGRLLGMGLSCSLFLYVAVNISMITGLIPVVGIPLPLLSYGGTAMLTALISLGLILSLAIHRDTRFSKTGLS